MLEMVSSRSAMASAELLALAFVTLIAIGSPSFAQSQSAPMPVNAQPKSYGDGWECDRGYTRDGDACLAIIVSENAYFDDASYGPGWSCNRGFAESDDGRQEIDLPDNAHLDRSGNRWECHRNFQRSQGRCDLND
ncbi:hypothetical protein [uncultured Roseobacter sp.]|uniref:hypothetical protein n=1 Tax=uncultured Roseobacter sp. TaxID=114847 RepID=UPI00262344FE|nr:hypothetical protein [uncultured Roseobacter sp.]